MLSLDGRCQFTHTMPFPCLSHAALCRGLERSLSERQGRGMAWERHGRGMACVNQTRSHCVNQMGKTQSKPFAERRGRGMAWERHGTCELAFRCPACTAHAPRCHLWSVRIYKTCPHKMYASTFSTYLSKIFLILRRTDRAMVNHVY
jgi:hypothetical protein